MSPTQLHPSIASRAIVFAFVVALGCVTNATAQFGRQIQPRQPTGESLVAVDLIGPDRLVKPSETFDVAVVFRIEPQWHIYWRNPGASGMATDVRVTAPAGFDVGKVRWPAPRSFTGEEGITYGYEGGIALFVPITAPATIPATGVALEFVVDWLVCRGICVTGSAKRTIRINDVASDPATREVPAVHRGIVDRSRANLPRPLTDLSSCEVRLEDGQIIIEGTQAPRDRVDFYPIESPAVTVRSVESQVKGDRYRVVIAIDVRPENRVGKPMTIGGVFVLDDGKVYQFFFDAEHPDRGPTATID